MRTPRLAAAGLGLVLLAGGLGLVVCGVESCIRKRAGAFENQAAAKGKAAEAEAKAGKQLDSKEEAQRAELVQAKAEATRRKAESDRLRAELAELKSKPKDPSRPAEEQLADLQAVVAKQDEVIEGQAATIDSQAVYIKGLEGQNLTLAAARDHWRASAEARADQVLSLELALEAQKALTKGALWKGRFQGFAFGFAGGDLSQRFSRR